MADVVLVKRMDIVPETLEDAGEGNIFKILDIIGKEHGAPFTFGRFEMGKSEGVEFDYDADAAACYLLEGQITLTEKLDGKKVREMKYEAGDVVYIPQKKDLVVVWSTESFANCLFVTYPHWR